MSVGVPAFGDSDGANRIPNAERSNLFLFADTALASAALVLAMGVTVLGLLLSLQWYNQPFLGAFLYKTGNLINARPLAGGEWAGLAAGLLPGDRLQKIDDRSLETGANVGAALNEVLSALPVGHVAQVQVLRFITPEVPLPAECLEFTSGIAECTFAVRLEQLPFADWVGYWGIGFVVAVSVLVIGAWLWLQHRQIASARALILIIAAGAITFVCRFEISSTYQLDGLMRGAIVALSFLLFQFGMVFPYPLTTPRRRRWLMPAGAGLAVGVLILSLLLSAQSNKEIYDLSLLIPLLFGVFTGVFFIISMIIRRQRAASAIAREQASVALVSMIVPLLPMALWWVTNLIERTQEIRGISFSTIYLQLPMIFFPLGMSYAVLLRGGSTAQNDRLVNDALVLGALGLLLTVGYLALTGAAYLLTAGFIRPDSPFLIAGTLFVIALVFSPLRVRMERLIETAFFRQRRYYGQRLEQFTRDLATAIETHEIVEKLDKELKEALSPQYSFIFVQNTLTGDYEPITDRATRRAQTDIRFKADGGLIRVLSQSDTIINLTRENFPSADLQSDRPRLAVLNAPIIARMQSLRRLNGFIALGPYRDNTPYSHEDLRFLEGIATQAAAALERAQVVLESQQNERELKVLVQVSASLNIAMDYDTLLEFIYAQASKVIDAPNFYIVLYDDRTGELTYAFYQDADERVPEREGYRWQADRDIFSEIVRSAQPYRTNNYARDMQRRGAPPENPQLRAWLGVPLNAGEGRCIGALALGTTEVGVTYTEEQTKLFWNIADLAATALYKLRLLEESKQLARQMQVLNATNSQLATFFEDIDALLQNITESAVAILDCEAGSLLLVDENQRNLVFRLAVGGSGDELLGTTIPIGSGIAGIVAATGQYMIVNDTQRDNRWYGELAVIHNSESPFTTTSILAVPLSSRNRVIGVLEVMNRRDGSGFDDNSANLLMTFAGQAAVAIENANLFRRTDEALAERVRQLFNMQRIDQELNRTLDFQRVVDLTVDNAIRESEADAALLALVSSDRLRFEVVGCAGYPERVVRIGDSFNIDHGILGHAYRRNRPLLTPTSSLPVQGLEILPGTVNQIAVPMITGEKVTGILLLETTAEGVFSQLTAEHIEGIAEHANTAISNAQLFAQLGRANKQRIEFISKVAHEFKTPLSSIKGYADILNTRALGALNEQQQNFINIIQRNALRLQQLVEDFTDVTAQETGNLKLNMAAVNFSNVVLDTVRPMQRAFDEKEQQVVLNVPDDLPYVWGDERRLIQVMTNFVSNANKYTKPGGKVTIFAEHTRNIWDEGGAAEVIHCSVTDTGIGMNQEDLQNLFKPYWRSENPDAREQPGTGLGMSLTRALIEAHGGRIWVESEPGVGTTFHFTMPLAGEREEMAE